MKKIIPCIALLIYLFSGLTVFAQMYHGGVPYVSYGYDQRDNPVAVPAPFYPLKEITGPSISLSAFKDISDVYYDSDAQLLYITDKGNNRIVILDKDNKLHAILETFGDGDKFSAPSSVCVQGNTLYVADTKNARIVAFDKKTRELIRVYKKPEVSYLGGYEYQPLKIAVDLAGRIYVVAKDINKGLMFLDENGEFQAFLGAPPVQMDFLDLLWKRFMTKAQRESLLKAVPTEYNSVSIDSKGFLYVTTQSQNVKPIARLNSQGINILKYEGDKFPNGDGYYKDSDGKAIFSTFVDLAVDSEGFYYGLDSARGRIFAYSPEGELLYAFGGMGSQKGTFYSPSSIEVMEEKLVVSDAFSQTVTIFAKTGFGKEVSLADTAIRQGHYDKAQGHLNTVLTVCPTYQRAYVALGRIEIQKKNYKKAMEYLQYVGNKEYYSDAYRGYRKDAAKAAFFPAVIALSIAAFAGLALFWIKKKTSVFEKITSPKWFKDFRYATYCCFHPFDGFWDVKREKKGNLFTANLIFLLFVLVYGIRVQFSGYLFLQGTSVWEINVLMELARILIPILLGCVSNWCFTTLMDGEGKLKDIYIATAYALKPYVLFGIPLFLLSHILVKEETFIYTALNSISIFWVLALLFIGMMVTHDYTLKKAVLTTILTLLGICLIIFLGIVFANILQDFVSFVYDAYKEIMYRIY